MSEINSFIVYDLNNTMDLVKSIDACKSYMCEHKANEANAGVNHEMIGMILHKLFDDYHGKLINEHWLTAHCIQRICCDKTIIETYSSLWCQSMRSDYARQWGIFDNYHPVIKSWLSTSKEFVLRRGKGGGWGRICDLSPES